MNQTVKLTKAIRYRGRVVKQLAGNLLPVDLSTIADKHNVSIKPKNNSSGVS